MATGPPALRGASIPVTLAFDLTLTGDIATMTGTTTLDRMDFGIGATVPDEGTLGHAVAISVSLNATRAAGG